MTNKITSANYQKPIYTHSPFSVIGQLYFFSTLNPGNIHICIYIYATECINGLSIHAHTLNWSDDVIFQRISLIRHGATMKNVAID